MDRPGSRAGGDKADDEGVKREANGYSFGSHEAGLAVDDNVSEELETETGMTVETVGDKSAMGDGAPTTGDGMLAMRANGGPQADLEVENLKKVT